MIYISVYMVNDIRTPNYSLPSLYQNYISQTDGMGLILPRSIDVRLAL